MSLLGAPTAGPAAGLRKLRGFLTDPSSVLLIGQLGSAGTAFVANIAAARVLEPAGRGELALLLQIAYLTSLGLILGTDRSVVAVFSGRPTASVTRAVLRLLAAPSSLCLAVAVGFLAIGSTVVGTWGAALGLALLFTVTNAFARTVRSIAIAADRRLDFLVYAAAGDVLLLGSIGAFFLLDVRSSALWMIGYVVAGTIPVLIFLARWLRTAPTATGGATVAPSARPSGADLSAARREGLALLPATLAHSGTLRIDRLLLAGLASTTALGIYATVATMTELVAWPLLAYADSRLGRWRRAHDEGTFSPLRILAAATGFVVIAGLLLGVVLHLVLVPLLGEEYRPALDLVGPLLLAAAVFGLSQLLVNTLTAIRRAGLASVVEVIGLAVSLVAYILLINRSGALGAAWGSVIGYSSVGVAAAVMYIVARRGTPNAGARDSTKRPSQAPNGAQEEDR